MLADFFWSEEVVKMANITLLSEGQAAVVLTVKIKTLQAWRGRGGGPKFVKVGRLVRYRQEDLEQFLSERTFTHTLPAEMNQ
jgi:predicted ATPase